MGDNCSEDQYPCCPQFQWESFPMHAVASVAHFAKRLQGENASIPISCPGIAVFGNPNSTGDTKLRQYLQEFV